MYYFYIFFIWACKILQVQYTNSFWHLQTFPPARACNKAWTFIYWPGESINKLQIWSCHHTCAPLRNAVPLPQWQIGLLGPVYTCSSLWKAIGTGSGIQEVITWLSVLFFIIKFFYWGFNNSTKQKSESNYTATECGHMTIKSLQKVNIRHL